MMQIDCAKYWLLVSSAFVLGFNNLCGAVNQSDLFSIFKAEDNSDVPSSNIPGLNIFIQQFGNQVEDIQNFINSSAEETNDPKPLHNKKTFADVRGQDSVLVEVREIVDFLKNPEKYKKFDAHLPRGVLFHGPPGTGKTLIAQAIAGEADCSFFYISGSEFVDRFVGMGARNVRELFKKVREAATNPSAENKTKAAILFIDEIDAVGGLSRGSPTGSEEYKQTLNELLNQLDGFIKDENIVVIGATNLLEAIDPALRRPGRLDRVIEVPLPTKKGRTDVLGHYLKPIEDRLAADVHVETIAERTIGFSGADLANLVNEAKLLAIRDEAEVVSMGHFDGAWDKIVMGLAGDLERNYEQKEKTAYHEAGHALIKYIFNIPIAKVTIVPRGSSLGVTQSIPKYEVTADYSRDEWLHQIMVSQGGFVAEKLVYGKSAPGVCSDLAHANNIAHAMVYEWGMGERLEGIAGNGFRSQNMRAFCDDEVKTILEKCLAYATTLINNNLKSLKAISSALIEAETLTGQEITDLLREVTFDFSGVLC